MQNLLDYEPSEIMMSSLESDFSDESLTATGSIFGNYLKTRQLTYDNVSSVLKTLLTIEDICILKAFAQLYQSSVKVYNTTENQHYVELTNTKQNVLDVLTPNIDELVILPEGSIYSEQNILKLLPKRDVYIKNNFAKIINLTRTCVYFNSYKFWDLWQVQKFDIYFRSSRIPFRLMYEALRLLKSNIEIRRYLFQNPNIKQLEPQTLVHSKLETLTVFNNTIAKNTEQLQAVKQIVAGPNPKAPYIVFGPPGTCKTTTIVEAILQLHIQKYNFILVTAGSACDTIALRMCEYFESNERLQQPFEASKKQLKRIFAFSNNLSTTHPKLLKRFECSHDTSLAGYKIIVATLCTVARLVTLKKVSHFTHIFIDEAAASTEPEALMGLVGTKSRYCHVILSGDHKQLGAVIKSDRAASLGLSQSLMERLLLNKLYEVDSSGNYDHTLQTRLLRNYRSHPAIVGIYNKLYYNGELIPLAPPAQVNQAANWNLLPNAQFPILFQATQGVTERETYSTSSFNKLEAEVVCWYVVSLLKDGLGGDLKVNVEDIGIVTPYLGQCKLLSRMLCQLGQKQVEVGSVESYQGREKSIIIVSLVCSFKSTHFLSNPRRLNVFLSRPKCLMILIGKPNTLSEYDDLKFIIDQCKLQGNFLTEEEHRKLIASIDQDRNKSKVTDQLTLEMLMTKLSLNLT